MAIEGKNELASRIQPGDFNALSWMSSHGKEVQVHSGKWIALKFPDGIVASSESLAKVLNEWQKLYPKETPFVFMVPREREGAFIP